MIYRGSRYEGLRAYRLKMDGRQRLMLEFPNFLDPDDIDLSGAITHIYRERECLDELAIRYGASDESLWYIIAQANNISDPLSIEPGTPLIIPVAEFRRRS